MKSPRLYLAALAAPAVAIIVLSGCAPQAPDLSGIGGGTPTDTIVPDMPQPTPTAWVVDDTAIGLPDNLGEDTVDAGSAPALPTVVEQSNRENLTFAPVGDFTATQTEAAFDYAAAFTAFRYNSGLWLPESMRARAPVVYYPYTQYLSADAAKRLEDALISADTVQQNQAVLDSLAPPAPPIGDGTWTQPAVANWTFGQPIFTVDGQTLKVAFEAAGAGVFQAKDGTYYGVVIRDRVAYSLVNSGGWRIQDWASERAAEQPQALDRAPLGRSIPQPLQIGPIPVEDVPNWDGPGKP